MSSNPDIGNAEDDKRTSDLLALLYPEEDLEVDASSFKDDEELAGLRSLRAMLADVSDEEPSDAVSNKLLALAAQHAPVAKTESRGIFAWLGDFLTPLSAHPGLAAAATLMLVVGVGGTLYLKGGAKIAEPTASSRGVSPERAPSPSPELAAEPISADEFKSAEVVDGVSDMDEEESGSRKENAALGYGQEASPADPKSTGTNNGRAQRRSAADSIEGGVIGGGVGRSSGGQRSLSLADEAEDRGGADKKKPTAESKREDQVRRVKDIDTRDFESQSDDAPSTSSSSSAAPPPPAQTTPSKSQTEKVAAGEAQEEQDTKTDRALRLHLQAQAAAKQNNCIRVLEIGQEIRKLDSAYYDRRFLTDDGLKTCRKSGTKSAPKKS